MSSKKRPDLYALVELLDNEGYTHKELEEKTGVDETHVSSHLKKLRKAKIVHRDSDDDDAAKNYIGPRDSAKSEDKLNAFQYILKSFWELEQPFKAYPTQRLDFTEKLLTSKYFNSVIATCGLKPIYEIFEEYMKKGKNEEFLSIASQTLPNQPELIEKYTIGIRDSMEKMEFNLESQFKCLDETRYLLKFLSRLSDSHIESVKFHRQHLAEPFCKLYRKLTQRDLPITMDAFVTEGIRKFLELDLYLSPLTSYPMNFPVDLLFERPFERLYTDFYISNEEDIRELVRRAHIVYSNFIGIVSVGVVNSRIPVADLEILLNQYIFFWNIASRYLDYLYDVLNDMFSLDRPEDFRHTYYDNDIYGPHKIMKLADGEFLLHTYLDTTGPQIINLADGKLLLSTSTIREMNNRALDIDVNEPTERRQLVEMTP